MILGRGEMVWDGLVRFGLGEYGGQRWRLGI